MLHLRKALALLASFRFSLVTATHFSRATWTFSLTPSLWLIRYAQEIALEKPIWLLLHAFCPARSLSLQINKTWAFSLAHLMLPIWILVN